MKTIAIIGAGQLGSRHLQSLAVLDKSVFEIIILDTQKSSIELALQRYKDVINENSPSITSTDSFDHIPSNVFAAIVATSSLVRRKVVENLLQNSRVGYLILEKFLFPRIEDYSIVGDLIIKNKVQTFVNTPRRTFDFYREIALQISFPFHMEAIGSQWGLGCNAIHFFDLFYYFNKNEPVQVFSNMDDEVIDSKRSGYKEFTGSFLIKDDSKNTCLLSSLQSGTLPIVVTITDSKGKWIIHESLGYYKYFNLQEDGSYGYNDVRIKLPFQSEATSKIIMDLYVENTCKITPYEDSSYLHQILLEEYIAHYSKFLQKKVDICPIT